MFGKLRCSLLWSNQGEHWISQQWNPHLPLVRVMVEKGQHTEVCLWYQLFWKWIVCSRIVIAPARLALAMFVKVLETAHHMEEDDFEIKILWLGTASNLDVNVVKWKQKLAGGPGCLCWWATSLGGYPRTSKRSTQIPILDLHSKLTASLVSESEWRFENVLIFGCIDCFSWFHFWQWWKFPCIASQTRHTKPWRPRVQMTGGALGWHVLESRPAGMAAPAVSKREVVAKHVKPHITLPATYIYFFLMLKVEN